MFLISKKQKGICKVLLFKKKIAGSIFAYPKNLLASGTSQPTAEGPHSPLDSSAGLCPRSAPREAHGICTDVFGSRAHMSKVKWFQEEVMEQPVLFFSCMFKSNNRNTHLPSGSIATFKRA